MEESFDRVSKPSKLKVNLILKPQNPYFKTKLCKFDKSGKKCRLGENCLFAHGKEELQQKPKDEEKTDVKIKTKKSIAKKKNKTNIISLPDETLVTIFSYLSTYDITMNIPLVCERFLKISEDQDLIKEISITEHLIETQDFPITRKFRDSFRELKNNGWYHSSDSQIDNAPEGNFLITDDPENEYGFVLSVSRGRNKLAIRLEITFEDDFFQLNDSKLDYHQENPGFDSITELVEFYQDNEIELDFCFVKEQRQIQNEIDDYDDDENYKYLEVWTDEDGIQHSIPVFDEDMIEMLDNEHEDDSSVLLHNAVILNKNAK